MTVLLAYASPPELAIVALVVVVVVAALLFAWWPDRHDPEPLPRRPRPAHDRTVASLLANAQTGRPRTNFRVLGPLPYDWSIDDPDLRLYPLGEVFVAPVGTVIDETFPAGPEWSSLGRIDGDSRSFLFESTTARRP